MSTREEITRILLLNSASVVKFTEYKGFIDNLIKENLELKDIVTTFVKDELK